MSDESCATCRFWAQYRENSLAGHCRRNTPVVLPGLDTVWPEVIDDDWCGEWQGAKRDEKMCRWSWMQRPRTCILHGALSDECRAMYEERTGDIVTDPNDCPHYK